MLLITGPPGVGKSTALKVLTAVQDIQLVEWESPVDIDNSKLGMWKHFAVVYFSFVLVLS
jgi:ABC-type nitrate/sulfonate/bicarbonate transport system ATPase subunit